MKFEAGTIIKGKDLKGYMLCKIITEDMVMRGFQYKIGMNIDVKPLARGGSCNAGLHFSLVQNILQYLSYGTKLAIVMIPDNEDVYVDDEKFRAHRLVIQDILPLKEVSTWEYLYKNGADITARNNFAVKWTAENGYLEVVKYLYENGADITEDNDSTIKLETEDRF